MISTFCDFKKENRGESMNYLAAVACVVALVLINIFGTESKDINGILSAAIMALVWGGVQRGVKSKTGEEDEDKKAPNKRR